MAWGAPSPSPAVASASFLSTKLLATFLLATASSPSSATCASAASKPAAAAAGASSQTPGVSSSFNRSISFSTPSDRFRRASSSSRDGSDIILGTSRLRSEEVPTPRISLRANSQRQRVVAMATNDAPASIPKVEKSDAEWRTILSPEQFRILRQKGTEWAGTGKYDRFYEDGLYECAACGTPLYKSTSKFKSGCGWPAFFEGLPGAITETPDADGRRIEITCTACGGHLGHNFKGEGFPTPTDERHCVNSISLKFTPADK